MSTNYPKLEKYCNNWLNKATYHERQDRLHANSINGQQVGPPRANSYTQNSILDAVDRFTTQYIVFNRLYTEAGKVMIAQQRVSPPRKPYAPLPDRESATTHIVNYLGGGPALKQEIINTPKWQRAVDKIVAATHNGHFYFHEDYATGEPDTDRDEKLIAEASRYQPKAILELIYQARCNLFHGEKELSGEQRKLLNGMSDFLFCLSKEILRKLRQDLTSSI